MLAIAEAITPNSHGEISASILRPYISEENYWILMHHEVYQARYYGAAAGIDAEPLIAEFADSPYHPACVKFCETYDMTSFDPTYDTVRLRATWLLAACGRPAGSLLLATLLRIQLTAWSLLLAPCSLLFFSSQLGLKPAPFLL